MSDIPAFVDQPEAFLKTIFCDDDIPSGYEILIWTLDDKRSHWCNSIIDAATLTNRIGLNDDTYVGMALRLTSFAAFAGEYERGGVSDCAAIGALWGDIDYDDGLRTKKDYFYGADEAMRFIRTLPLQPTMIVDSGGGYHVYWCFKELWVFETQTDLHDAELLSIRWRETLKVAATRWNRQVDSVGDLARVMRMPNTYNHKLETLPRFCQIVELNDDVRYDPSQFNDFLVSFDVNPKNLPQTAHYDFVLSPTALPPLDKWEALKAVDKRVELSYLHARRDMKDRSPSGYDLSLASFAVQAGWTNQEIVNLLVACRRDRKVDLKMRPQYYWNTIQTARENVRYLQALDDLQVLSGKPQPPNIAIDGTYLDDPDDDDDGNSADEVATENADIALSSDNNADDGSISSSGEENNQVTAVEDASNTGNASNANAISKDGDGQDKFFPPIPAFSWDTIDAERKKEQEYKNPVNNPANAAVIDTLEAILKFRIMSLTKYTASDPVYILETNAGRIQLGDVTNLICQAQFRAKVAALTGILIPTLKTDKWNKVAQLLLNLCTSVSTGPENTMEWKVEDWLLSYFENWPVNNWDKYELSPAKEEAMASTIASHSPFVENSYICIWLDHLRDWLFKRRGEVVGAKQLAILLRESDWEPYRINCTIAGKQTTRNVWRREITARDEMMINGI